MPTPLIESGDCTLSGSNTEQATWAVSVPNAAVGDLLLFNIAWDDSVNNTDVSPPSGPNGETISTIAGPTASASTEIRIKAWRTIATGTWTAGTITFSPNATESWSATVARIPAGEFDASTPIGASSTAASTGTAESAVNSPAFTAGATDGFGLLCAFMAADADPITAAPAGWSQLLSDQDLGAVAHNFDTRNAAVTNSESISAASWTIASDSWASLAYIVRPAFSMLKATESGDSLASSSTIAWIPLTYTVTPQLTIASSSISAALNKTESNDTLSAGVTIPISVTFGVTESADTLASGASFAFGAITATLGVTEASDTAYGFYSNWIPLDYTVTPTLTIGSGMSAATFSVLEASDAVSSSATSSTLSAATFSVTEASDTISSGATTSAFLTSASLNKTESSDTAYGFYSNWVPLTYTVTPSLTITGGLSTVSLNVTESADTISATATIPLPAMSSATFGVTEANDAITADYALSRSVGILTRLGFDGYGVKRAGSFTGRVAALNADFAVTEASDTVSVAVGVGIAGTVSVSENADTSTGAVGVEITASASVSEAADTISSDALTSLPAITGSVNVTEANDTYSSFVEGGTPIIVATGGGRGTRSRKLRILPDKTRIYATESEVRKILETFYRPKTIDDVKLQPKKVQAKIQSVPSIELVQFDKHVPNLYQLKTEKRMQQADYAQFLKTLKQREEEEKFLEYIMEII